MSLQLLDVINYQEPDVRGLAEPQGKFLEKRLAVRAVAFDSDHRLHLLSAWHRTSKYMKLPGGGVDKGEDLVAALQREVDEELGYQVRIGQQIGRVMQFEPDMSFRQDSICWLAEITGGDGRTSHTAEEVEHHLQGVTFDSLEAAISAMLALPPGGRNSRSIVRRDLAFLLAAQRLLAR